MLRPFRHRRRSGTDDGMVSMYKPHEKVYPREVSGRFQRLRMLAVFVLLGLYYLLPWLEWDGRQAVLFDLPARQFHVLGITFWPQDFFFLALLLIMAGLSLFFFTALAGRLWCGYACPQTVWTEVFLWIERKVEGDRARRMKLDAAPWTANKLWRKGLKQALWISFAAWTGFTFVGFFTPIHELGERLLAFELGPWESFWLIFYGFATYGNAGYLREQVCIYMCPYARFQSAMFDKDTLIIGYDEQRGEPRGSRKRGVDPSAVGLGDCIDCTLCVQVCPTGIDIRKGLQYECIACAACVDVCDSVMDRMGYEPGLIRYATEHEMQGREARVLRPRVLVYGAILLSMFIAWGWAIADRTPLRLDVLRDRNALYQEVEGGIENVYTLKVMNMSPEDRRFEISVDGIDGVALVAPTGAILVAGGKVASVPARIRVPAGSVQRMRNDLTLTVVATDDPDVVVEELARFLAPVSDGG